MFGMWVIVVWVCLNGWWLFSSMVMSMWFDVLCSKVLEEMLMVVLLLVMVSEWLLILRFVVESFLVISWWSGLFRLVGIGLLVLVMLMVSSNVLRVYVCNVNFLGISGNELDFMICLFLW